MEGALLGNIVCDKSNRIDKRRCRNNRGVHSASDGLRGLEYKQEHKGKEERIRHESEHIEERNMVAAGRAHQAHQYDICGRDAVINLKQPAVSALVKAEGKHGDGNYYERPYSTREADIIRLAEIDDNR